MTKTITKTSLTLRIFSVALVVLVSGSRNSTDDPFLDHLKARLKQYYSDFHAERTYLLTDRFAYKPGEDLWFKGFITSSGEHQMELKSEDFFIKLLNNKGQEIISRRYPVNGNQINGRLLIPRTSIPGRYWLVAYSGWMKNQCYREAFRKEILISKYFEKRFQVEGLFDKSFYYAEDTLNAYITILDPYGKPIPEIDFDYTVGSFAHHDTRGTANTDEKGMSKITCTIPQSDETLFLTIEIRSRKLSGDYSLIIPALTSIPEIVFFPEGGNLVKGIPSLVAFRSTGTYGQPVSIKGDIIDHKGNRLQTVATSERGIGKFEYLPQNDTCYLSITTPTGLSRKYPLPMARDNGFIIHCEEQGSDSVTFRIKSALENSSVTTTYWVASMKHQIVWSDEISFKGSARINIPVGDLSNGILQVSVFDQDHHVAAERLVNILNAPELIRVKTDHKVYHSRQRVNLSLEFSGADNSINMTMAVALRHLSSNPLNVGFKETAENMPCDTTRNFLIKPDLMTDLDLMTTDYRTIYWNEVLMQTALGQSYTRHDGITGRVFDKKDILSKHAKVRVTHIPNYRSYETQTDETGTFHVGFGSDIIDFNYLNVDAYDALGKVNLTASIDQEYSERLRNKLIGEGEDNDWQKTSDVVSYGEADLIFVLRYGPGKFRKSIPETKKKYDPNQYAGYTNVLDIIQDIKPYTLVDNTIVFNREGDDDPGVMFRDGAIIVINGALKGYKVGILDNILPSDITNINISTSLLDIHKYTPINFQGVIEITTIQGMYKYRQPTVQLGMDILNTNREFYSPDYSVESSTSVDNRKTLYWNPHISLQSGQSALISFYTSDLKGIYNGIAEGFDEEGNPVKVEFSFVVE